MFVPAPSLYDAKKQSSLLHQLQGCVQDTIFYKRLFKSIYPQTFLAIRGFFCDWLDNNVIYHNITRLA